MREIDWYSVAVEHVHPIRLAVMDSLRRSPLPLSPSDMCALNISSAPLGSVSYHVRALAKLGLLEQTYTLPRRGATEHFYRLSTKAIDA